MYCIHCGVELGKSEQKCPLCGTAVYHPEYHPEQETPPYPRLEELVEHVSRVGALFLLTTLFSIALVLSLFCDIRLNGELTWAGYAAGGILLCYVVIVLPLWFARPNPVIFVPADFAAACIYLLYISVATSGGWFLSFAFPVTGALAVIITAVIALLRYLRRGRLFVFSGAWFALSGLFLLIEFLLNLTFRAKPDLVWSPYPSAACVLVGGALLVVAICRPIRDSLHKRFFI